MQHQLLKVNEDYPLLLESINGGMSFYTDHSGKILSWSANAEQITNYKADEAVSSNIQMLYITKKTPLLLSKAAIHLQKNKRYQFESWLVTKEGKKIWSLTTFVTPVNSNATNDFLVLVEDYTAQQKQKEKLLLYKSKLNISQQKEQKELSDYKQALDESSIVAITDQKGKINYVNDNFCRISKYAKEELIGQDHRIINSAYHPKDFIRNLWTTIANGKIWRGELKNIAKDGSYYWVDTTIIPFLNEKGKPYQYLAIRNDITKRKAAEEQIIKLNENLEKKIRERTLELTEALEREKQLNEMKSTFVSVASHEFKTPLSTILSSVGLIEHYKEAEQPDKQQKHIDRIKNSVKNLTDILNDFLSLDKLEQGLLEARSTSFNFEDVMKDVMDEMDALYKRKQQTIKLILKEPIPVEQDRKILRNVLLNLLSNAIKYSAEKKEITIVIKPTNDWLTVAVKDKGYGIPAEAQKDIFSKFFRAANVANLQGTGLGLNIVKKYMELLGGNISFTSIENKGSVFTIEFPRFKR